MRTLQTVKAKTLTAPSILGQHVAYYLNKEGMVIANDTQSKETRSNCLIYTKNIMHDTRVCRGNTYARPIRSESDRRNQYLQQQKRKLQRTRHRTEVLCSSCLKILRINVPFNHYFS